MGKVRYTNLKDRANKVKSQEAKGLTMLQDEFDSDWKRGNEPHGVMTFDVVVSAPFVEPEPQLSQEELKKIRRILATG